MKRIAAGVVGLALLLTGWWWALGDREPRVVEPGTPLALDETVRMRWADEESGEEEVWTVTKRDTTPDERVAAPPLPDPAPRAASHVPDESARALDAIALEAWKNGEVREAIAHLERAVEIDPDDPLPRTHLGRLHMLSMSYGSALPHLERAAELNSDDPQTWLDLATLYEKSLVLERAWEARRRAEALADGQEIYQDDVSGFWLLEGNSAYP